MKSYQITLKPLSNNVEGMLSDHVLTRCSFCYKACRLSSQVYMNLYQLSKTKRFFCGFCTRSGFCSKKNNEILILTFKNVFNQFYHQNHLNLKKMWVSEIKDLVDIHKKIGLENPIFNYDDESMNWFIDFSKVGNSKGKLKLEHVKKTTCLIVDEFKIDILAPEIGENILKQKYLSAIDLFHKKRYRPKGKTILSPTFGVARKEMIIF